MKTLSAAVLAFFFCLAPVCARSAVAGGIQAAAGGYPDPALEDFAETAYGYLNPANRPPADLRDAPAPEAAAVAVGREAAYVYVRLTVLARRRAAVLKRLLALGGFVIQGGLERGKKLGNKAVLSGWIKASSLDSARTVPGVLLVRTGTGKTSL